MSGLRPTRSFTPTTAAEILVLNGDSIHRELIRGELRERSDRLNTPRQARAAARLCRLLGDWLETQPEPRGELLAGNAGFILSRDPDSIVAIDVAYISADTLARTPPEQFCVEEPPVLAVEILAPWDTHGSVVERVELYLEHGSVVWVAAPDFQTVTVHRPGHLAEGLNTNQELNGDPYLPGLKLSVAAIFGE